jgi:hypothetical protein
MVIGIGRSGPLRVKPRISVAAAQVTVIWHVTPRRKTAIRCVITPLFLQVETA